MYDELVKSLRQCAEASCAGCKNDLVQIGCRGLLQHEAADAIEAQDRHILTLQREMMAEAESNTALVERLNKQIERLAKNSQKIDNGFGEWIPVTERLPEMHTNVLVMDKAHDMAVGSREKLWDGEIWVCPFSAIDMDQCPITHWMPLPEPPKEET